MLFTNELCLLFICYLIINANEEIFKQDISEGMQIGIPEGGYKSVKLKCGSNSMYINLETENDFFGVIYTRGSFHEKQIPCFLDPGYQCGQRSFSIQFPLDKCKTLQKGDVYSNVLVVQNDKDLIMPGDAAFNLECDFTKPRNITVNADLEKSSPILSKITVTNPDMNNEKLVRQKRATAKSNSDTVEFKLITY